MPVALGANITWNDVVKPMPTVAAGCDRTVKSPASGPEIVTAGLPERCNGALPVLVIV